MPIVTDNNQLLRFNKGFPLYFSADTRFKLLKDLAAFLDQSPGEILIKLQDAMTIFGQFVVAAKNQGSPPLPFCTVVPIDLLAMHVDFEHLFDLFVLEPDFAIDLLTEVIKLGMEEFPETKFIHQNDIFVSVKLTSVPPLEEKGNSLISIRGVLMARTLSSKYL